MTYLSKKSTFFYETQNRYNSILFLPPVFTSSACRQEALNYLRGIFHDSLLRMLRILRPDALEQPGKNHFINNLTIFIETKFITLSKICLYASDPESFIDTLDFL